MNEKIYWRLESRNIEDLKPYHKNPRRLTKDQEKHLRTSLDKFGMIDRPCINTDNTIIGGHQRINVLGKNIKNIEVYVPSRSLDEKEVEELNIRLNKNQGEFDYDILANEFELQDLFEWGFDSKELAIEDIEVLKPIIDKQDDEIPKVCPACNQKIK